jgi:Fuc2NAc and GlcNAc transferase
LAINVAWLFPIAFLVANADIPAVTGVLVAYLPLIIAMYAFGAGKD